MNYESRPFILGIVCAFVIGVLLLEWAISTNSPDAVSTLLVGAGAVVVAWIGIQKAGESISASINLERQTTASSELLEMSIHIRQELAISGSEEELKTAGKNILGLLNRNYGNIVALDNPDLLDLFLALTNIGRHTFDADPKTWMREPTVVVTNHFDYVVSKLMRHDSYSIEEFGTDKLLKIVLNIGDVSFKDIDEMISSEDGVQQGLIMFSHFGRTTIYK